MTGQEVKQILISRGVKIVDLAEKMGESQQNLSSLLKVQDIKTGTLERIAEASCIPLQDFFGISPFNIANGDGNTQVAGNVNNVNAEISKLIDSINKKDEQIDRLLSIIESMSKQK